LQSSFELLGQQCAESINQSINLFVMKQSKFDTAVTALTGTTRLKSAYGNPK